MRGSLTKRGKTSWRYRFDGERGLDGNRNVITGTIRSTTKKAAEEELRSIMSETETGGFLEPSKATVAEHLKKWLETVEADLGSTTVERYAQACNSHVIPALGEVRLQKLRPTQIQDFINNCRKDGRLNGEGGLSARSALHIHRIFKLALKQAVGWKLISSNPMDGITAPSPDKPEVEVLDKAETATLLKAAEGRPIYTTILLAVTTGMRRGELLALRWSDIDFVKGHLDVNQTLVETKAKGLEFKAPKSKSGKRRISLPAITIEELKRHRNRQAEKFFKLGFRPGNDDLVFLSIHADGTIGARKPWSLTKVFSCFIKSVKVPQITLHGLRHSHITHLLMDGEPINVVSKRAGHSTVSITLDVYGHVLKENQRELADSYGNALELALAEHEKNG
jgi:integrase